MTRCYRKVIHIQAADSPNVKMGLMFERAGLPVPDTVVLPGVITYAEYKKRLATWDNVRICIGIHGQFWEGAEVLLYPPDWLNHCERRAAELVLARTPRHARALGVDPGEGGANTAWSVVDSLGLIHQVAFPTPDTSVIVNRTIALMREFRVPADDVVFDRGGGGKQVADEMRSRGHRVRTVAFGEPVTPDPRTGTRQFGEKIDVQEQRYTYVSRRAQMYGELHLLMDPSLADGGEVFAIPAEYGELRRQLSVFPLLYDKEGRLYLPPKSSPPGRKSSTPTLVQMIGRSPDEADSLVLAVHGMLHKLKRPRAGVS